jgi:hypothetical protein
MACIRSCYKGNSKFLPVKVPNSHNLSILYLIAAFMALITLIIVGPYGVHAQTNVGNSTIAQKMGVKITSPKTNQIVPVGPLTIKGTSSDTPNTNCQVYVDWNDTKPMQNVTAKGPGGPSDYSNWTFTYTQNYHPIMAGMNELTSKITCNHDSASIGNVPTKFYSINITGTSNETNFSLSAKSNNLSSTGTAGFYNARFTPLLPQYSNDTNQSYVAAANINTNSEAATYDNITDNTHLVKESSGDDSSSSSSSKEDNHDNHNSDNNDKSNSDDTTNDSNGNKKVEIHVAKHLKSTKVENIGHNEDKDKHKYKLNFKRHNDNTKTGDLHKYIHDLIKKKMKRVSDRVFG